MTKDITEELLFNSLKETNYIVSSANFLGDIISYTIYHTGKTRLTAKDIVDNIEKTIFYGLGLSYMWKPVLSHYGITSFSDFRKLIEILVKTGSLKLNNSSNIEYFDEIEKIDPLFKKLQSFEDSKLKDLLIKNKK